MNKDKEKSHDELINELNQLRNRYEKLKQSFKRRNIEYARELSERNQAEKELKMSQLIVEQSPVVLFRRKGGDNTQLEYISENIRQFGYSPEEFLRGDVTFRDIVHPEDRDRIGEEIRHHLDNNLEEYTQYYRILTRTGTTRWIADRTSVVQDNGNITHHQGILIDFTERKLAQEELRKSEEKFRRIVETTAEGFLLMDCELRIKEVNNAYCRMLGYPREELIGKKPFDLATDNFKEFLLVNQEAMLAQEYRVFEGSVIAKDGREIPVLIHGNTLRDDNEEIIGNMAFVTDMTEHKKTLLLAGEVQKSLLPRNKPPIKGLDVAGRNVSCDEIGGDYFDFLWRPDAPKGPLGVVVGDIAGHGVDSALLMTTARAFLRMRASQPGTMSEIISAMNRHLTNDVLDSGKFMTLFFLSIDQERKCVEWVRAGHDPALVYDPILDSFEELKGQGIALGLLDEAQYLVHKKDGLANGQIIAVGTDGIWEAFNREGEMFGKERVQQIIRTNKNADAETILNTVYDELNSFTLGQKKEDDITLVIIKINGLP